MSANNNVRRRLQALEPGACDDLLVRDLDAAIAESETRLMTAEDLHQEFALMLQEVAAIRCGKLSHEEAKIQAEEIEKAVSLPWLSKESTEPSKKRRGER